MSTQLFDRTSTLELLQLSEDLPSLPDQFIKIQNIAQDPESSADDLANVIRHDQATTVMILKFANSPAYNPSGTAISELSKAIARLGNKEAIHIASAMSLMYGLILPTGMANIRTFWAHAFGTALVAEYLSKKTDPGQQLDTHESAFMAGLMHDIGRAAFGMRVDFNYFERETGHLQEQELIAMEEEYYGVNHAEAGSHLLQLWNFPSNLCEAIAGHHLHDSPTYLASLCYLASQFTNAHLSTRTPFDNVSTIIHEALKESPPELETLQSYL